MKYGLVNLYTNSAHDQKINDALKSYAYNAKLKNKITGQVEYTYILIPFEYKDFSEDYTQYITEYAAWRTSIPTTLTTELLMIYHEIYQLLEISAKIENSAHYTFDVITVIDDSKLDIFYTDGSSTGGSNGAAYATLKLLNESSDADALYDLVSGKYYKFTSFSEKIDEGTNNIGELTGVKTAIENQGNAQFQVIVSDSEYSLKCFREWIYNWKTNGYKGSNKKQILNCELIKDIQNKIETSGKIYLFNWIKGHNGTPMNELCDKLAKSKLGLS